MVIKIDGARCCRKVHVKVTRKITMSVASERDEPDLLNIDKGQEPAHNFAFTITTCK